MKKLVILLGTFLLVQCSFAQDEEVKEKGFKKEKLFSGGTISLSFFNNTFLIGGNPIFGYSLTNWADVGVVANYNYSSTRDYQYVNDRLRQTNYGGGVFTRLFPVNFLFAQAQFEHNFITQKFVAPPNSGLQNNTYKTSGNSFLIGGGYTSGRYPGNNNFFFLSLLFDVSNNPNSPYTDYLGRPIPVIRGGFNVALFQKGRNR
jgi:hypothetical protein